MCLDGDVHAMAASDDDRSSINLSLRLRRGSSDSRDSFYMDLDRGIDSDIEMEPLSEKTAIELDVVKRAPGGNVDLDTTAVLVPLIQEPQRESDTSGDCASEQYLEGDYPGKDAKE